MSLPEWGECKVCGCCTDGGRTVCSDCYGTDPTINPLDSLDAEAAEANG